MIIISGNMVQPESIGSEYAPGSVERTIINTLASSHAQYSYDSLEQLNFEIRMRKAIIVAAIQLYKSGLEFEVFHKARSNPAFWNITREGGFLLKNGVKPSEAIRDIFQNGPMYGTECATAIMIIYYGALLEVYGNRLFDKTFPKIELMNWHHIDSLLRDVGYVRRSEDYFPGDRRYFANPDVDPLTPEWQGENVIDLGGGRYYGHGIGINNADGIIRELNQNRIEGADESARLLDSAGRPDFKMLYDVYSQSHA